MNKSIINKKIAVQLIGSEAELLRLVDAKAGRNPGEVKLLKGEITLSWEWRGNSPRYQLNGSEGNIARVNEALDRGEKNFLMMPEPEGAGI
jgi:hypothetical protein